ncbi:MAG TPA: hypothetical protein PKM63_12175 [Panacibacter sp.]|nr:hypothetical protein [Panacibacter sp.]HNP45036.1 hypothetical protein [Panacibacter sp.]
MRSNVFSIIFLVLGIAAICGCLWFALLPTTHYSVESGKTYINKNAGMASIAMAIISVGCFVACTILLKKK